MQKINCQACDKEFTPQRKTATFCSSSCRSNYYQKKQRRERRFEQLQKRQTELEEKLKEADLQLLMAEAEEHGIQQTIHSKSKRLEEVKRQLSLDAKSLLQENQWNEAMELARMPMNIERNWMTGLLTGYLTYQAGKNLPLTIPRILQDLSQEQKQLQATLTELSLKMEKANQQVALKKKNLHALQKESKSLVTQLKQLENEIRLAQKREKQAPSKTSKSTTPNLPASVKGKDLLTMEFDTFQLEGEIGKFLGEMDRHMMAIGLMGDYGGGKSFFTVALAQAFEKADFSVAYFSLEMGIGKSLKRAIEVYPVDEVEFIKKGGIEEVRACASQYNVIFIDSYGKLNCDASMLDKLRHEYPETIFVFIFQKTTQGSPRGGFALLYDCTMIINLTKNEDGDREAFMQKSRYGTIGSSFLPEKNEYRSN